MAIKKNQKFKKGIIIIEVLIAIFIIGFVFVGFSQTIVSSLRVSTLLRENIEANNLAQEAMEAVRNFRDGVAWNNNDPANQYNGLGVVATGVAHRSQKSTDNPPKWMLLRGQETVGIFTRKIVFENVSRNPVTRDIELTYNPANNDSNTKKVTTAVFWKDKKVEIVTYLTNWQE